MKQFLHDKAQPSHPTRAAQTRAATPSASQKAARVCEASTDCLRALCDRYGASTNLFLDIGDYNQNPRSASMSVMGIWTKPLARRTLARARMRVHRRFQPRKRWRENRSSVTMRPSLGEAFTETSIHTCCFPQNPLLTVVSRLKIDCNPIAQPGSAANASGLVQIPLSQVRRKTVCSIRLQRAPAYLSIRS